MKILVVGGHPADMFDHCGGTLSHHVKNGDSVTTLALTQGLRIHDEVISEVFRFGTEGYTKVQIETICKEREQVKYKEVTDACALFGITDVAELKVKALDMMRSQQYQGAYARRHTEVWSGKDGHFMDTGYCESFVFYRPEVGRLLTVSDYLRKKANEPEKEKRARCSQMIAEFME